MDWLCAPVCAHGVLQCAIGYVGGKNRTSMKRQYGHRAHNISASGLSQQSVPWDWTNFLLHFIPITMPLALMEEARVAKVSP